MRRQRPVYVNTMQRAAARAAYLSQADRTELTDMATRALDRIRTVSDPVAGWCQMADILNMAEAMATAPARHAVASDEGSKAKIAAAQAALGEIHKRAHGPQKSWAARASEMDALREAVWLWGIQLEHCTVGELDAATRCVANRVRQALAGNAPKGTQVVTSMEAAM